LNIFVDQAGAKIFIAGIPTSPFGKLHAEDINTFGIAFAERERKIARGINLTSREEGATRVSLPIFVRSHTSALQHRRQWGQPAPELARHVDE
jgi:hypothetical protein